MRFLVFQHAAHESLGLLEVEAKGRGIALDLVRFYRGGRIPVVTQYDALIVMGGPMGVYDEKEYRWLRGENAAIQEALGARIPYLGICLGGQLLAKALRAPVTKNAAPEIGFDTIDLTPEGQQDPLFQGFEVQVTVFQWHGDTFALPAGAVQLASSPRCAQQAFRWGQNAYALQPHVEVTPRMVARWVQEGWEEIARLGLDGPAMVAQAREKAPLLRQLTRRLFANFISICK